MLPLLPVALQCAVECTFPIPEESSAALLMLTGNLLGLGFTYGIQGLSSLTADISAVRASVGLLPSGWFSIGIVSLAAVPIFRFQGAYLRLQAEGRGSRSGEPLLCGALLPSALVDEVSPHPYPADSSSVQPLPPVEQRR